MSTAPRTLVEFVEQLPEGQQPLAHKARAVYIDGKEVLVERDSIDLTFGNEEVTKITLTIIPTEVRFTSKERPK